VIIAQARSTDGRGRNARMARSVALASPPDTDDLAALRDAARGCTACELHRDATQTVFGEGAPDARVVFVGEQPGDQEDRAGRPFVGPAGKLLDRALDDAGIERGHAYVTNAVKHFRFERTSNGRRLHKTPGVTHIRACHPWMDAEIAALAPELVVALGATAARGAGTRLTPRT
jgi:uracil-DNA glycosylase family protein